MKPTPPCDLASCPPARELESSSEVSAWRRRGFGSLLAAAVVGLVWAMGSPPVTAGAPGPVPDGVYNLNKISSGRLMGLGTLEIKGTSYRVGDDKSFAPFTLDAGGNITWSAGLNFMPEGWKLGTSTFIGLDEFKRPLIKIHYLSPRSAAEVIDCVKEK
jgi:hypothetical protein